MSFSSLSFAMRCMCVWRFSIFIMTFHLFSKIFHSRSFLLQDKNNNNNNNKNKYSKNQYDHFCAIFRIITIWCGSAPIKATFAKGFHDIRLFPFHGNYEWPGSWRIFFFETETCQPSPTWVAPCPNRFGELGWNLNPGQNPMGYSGLQVNAKKHP